jgi:predicted ester cyclase
VSGPAGYMLVIGMMRGGFSDVQWTLEELVTEGDTVACRFTMRGTHDGMFFGLTPTGKHVEMQAVNFYRIVDGKIVAERGQPDLFGLLKQIGGIPA